MYGIFSNIYPRDPGFMLGTCLNYIVHPTVDVSTITSINVWLVSNPWLLTFPPNQDIDPENRLGHLTLVWEILGKEE